MRTGEGVSPVEWGVWAFLPFVPDTSEVLTFQGYVYQAIDVNSCGREELEAFPFLTPAQIDSILKHRPYYGWEDFVRRSGLPWTVSHAIKGILLFGNEERYYALFVRGGLRDGKGEGVLSFKGREGKYLNRLYLSRSRQAVAIEYGGFVRIAAGNYVLASPLGFSGYGGFYTGGWGLRYSPYAPPSLALSVGLWTAKLDTVGLIFGVSGREGGLLLARTWRGEMEGVGYLRYGPVVLESALSRKGTGFGIAAYRNGIGFRLRYVKGERVWSEGSFSKSYAVWFSVPLKRYLVRAYLSDRRRRVSLSLSGEGYGLRLEYYEVWRFRLYVQNVEFGLCNGCMWGGYRWGWGWFRAYAFAEDGIPIYESVLSSRLITSEVGYRVAAGLHIRRRVGIEGYNQNGRYGIYVWASWAI